MKKHILKAFAVIEDIGKILALFLSVLLLLASALIISDTVKSLIEMDLKVAIQDGLFVLILLEMFYVIRSFIKYSSINVGLIINIGIIATIKELVFRLDRIDLQLAIAFGVIIISLGVTYLLEVMHFSRKKDALVAEKERIKNMKLD